MASLAIYEVEAFGERAFGGNPAAVVPLDRWLDDGLLQAVALNNNLAETAYLVRQDGHWAIRWFTPAVEVPLCGHATLAAGFVIMTILAPETAAVSFASRSGPLGCTRTGDLFTLDFPARALLPGAVPGLGPALGANPAETGRAGDMVLCRFDSAAQVAALAPDFARLKTVPALGVMATAPAAAGSGIDFVSRFFAPGAGIDEDPVTGSAHCVLAPYWGARLGKTVLEARQISPRGGRLCCTLAGDRVAIAGPCRLYLEGRIHL